MDNDEDFRSSKRWDWFQMLLNSEKKIQLTPEVKLTVIRELILESQKKGVERALRRTRVRLKKWMYISLCVALLRLTCMIAILYLLLIIRYKHFWYVVNMITLKSNFIYKMTYQGLTLFIMLIFFNILVELILMLSFQVQRSSLIAFTYALNFVLVILLIAMFPFIVGFRINVRPLIRDLFGLAIIGNSVEYDVVETMHREYKCCGLITNKDWTNEYIMKFRPLFTNLTTSLINDLSWFAYCTKLFGNHPCAVPNFCCRRDNCHFSNNTSPPSMLFSSTTNVKDAYKIFKHHIYNANITGLYRKPCFTSIAESVEVQLTMIAVWLVALAILTIVMTVLIMAVLLYNSAYGEVLTQFYRVRSPHSASLVWFFKKLDEEKDCFDDDLTDYSVIERLKKFDIDKDLTDMK